MSVIDIGKQLVSLCKQGKNQEAIDTLYSPDIVSGEGIEIGTMDATTKGLDALNEAGPVGGERLK